MQSCVVSSPLCIFGYCGESKQSTVVSTNPWTRIKQWLQTYTHTFVRRNHNSKRMCISVHIHMYEREVIKIMWISLSLSPSSSSRVNVYVSQFICRREKLKKQANLSLSPSSSSRVNVCVSQFIYRREKLKKHANLSLSLSLSFFFLTPLPFLSLPSPVRQSTDINLPKDHLRLFSQKLPCINAMLKHTLH